MNQNSTKLVQQKKSFKKGNKKPKSLTGKVMKISHELSKLRKDTKPEIKSALSRLVYTQFDSNGQVIIPINAAIAQGTDIGGRIGRDVQCHGIDFRYYVRSVATTKSTSIRVIVYIDKDNSNTAVSDVLNALAAFTIGNELAPLSFYNRNNRNTFKILYDRIHDFDFASGDLQASVQVNLKTDHITKFIDNSTTITENAVRVLCISSETAASGLGGQLGFVAQYYYTDV